MTRAVYVRELSDARRRTMRRSRMLAEYSDVLGPSPDVDSDQDRRHRVGWSAAGAVSELAATIPAMDWPPQIGDVLPRADTAWHERVKLEKWILAERGHGSEWRRVFHVGARDRERVWEAIALAARGASISTVRGHGSDGIVCGVPRLS